MRNLIITIIALVIIVGIIAFISFNYGKKGYFDLKFVNSDNNEVDTNSNADTLPTPKTAETDSKIKTTNNNTQTNPTNDVKYLAPTGAPAPKSTSQLEIQTYKATQTTIVIINGKKQTYNQETYFNSAQKFSQYQKAIIKY